MYTTGTAFLEALHECGITHIFANLGSDHPALLESTEEAKVSGRRVPRLITCPNEMIALSAAQGYAQSSGRAQAVLVHVDCGTQALGGALHNAAKARVPVLIFAGSSPYTQEGERRGSRNEFIQWIQDVHDQRGIVRGYMRYDNELRTGRNVKQMVYRAMQFAYSDPQGPVYLVGAREVMEEELSPEFFASLNIDLWRPIAPCALPAEGLSALLSDLRHAKNPLVVTSFLGRNPQAVKELQTFTETLSIPVLESVPSYTNLPATHPLYMGNQWNAPCQNEVLAEADLVLVIDSDVPWIPLVSRPAADATVYYIDIDPLKQQMPLWYIPAKRIFRADAHTALKQLNEALQHVSLDEAATTERRTKAHARHAQRERELREKEQPRHGALTPEYLTACIREFIDADTIVCNEGISNYDTIINHLAISVPGGMIASGGGSLGWNGGAALGIKMAHPDKTVIALCGDGSYLFSVPSSVHWMARRYEAPFLTVVYNNGGWKSPKLSALAVHPDGYTSRSRDLPMTFTHPADYAGIAAAAGGAHAETVTDPSEVKAALERAFKAVRDGRAAVLNAVLERF
jgi:acetolactate synthase I/II/III large subunit